MCTAWCLVVAVRGRSAVVGAVVHARRQHQHHDADGSAAGGLLGVAHQHDVTHLRGVCDGERQHVQQAQYEPRGEWLCVWVQCALLIVSMRHDAAADRVSRCDGAVTCQHACVCVFGWGVCVCVVVWLWFCVWLVGRGGPHCGDVGIVDRVHQRHVVGVVLSIRVGDSVADGIGVVVAASAL